MKVEIVREEPKELPIREVVLRLSLNGGRKLADICGANLTVPAVVAHSSGVVGIERYIKAFMDDIFQRLSAHKVFRNDANWKEPS